MLTYIYQFDGASSDGPIYRLFYPLGFDNRAQAYGWIASQKRSIPGLIVFEVNGEEDAPVYMLLAA